MEPPNVAVPIPTEPPPVLVDQLVVEAAHQHQVVQVGTSSVLPPRDVVSMDEPALGTPGEGALAVPVLQLAEHPLRRLPPHPAQPDHLAGTVLQDHLDPGVAPQAPSHLGVEHRTPFELGAVELALDSDRAHSG